MGTVQEAYQLLDQLYSHLQSKNVSVEPLYCIVGYINDQLCIRLAGAHEKENIVKQFTKLSGLTLFSIQRQIPADRSLITSFVLHAKDVAEPAAKKPAVQPEQPKTSDTTPKAPSVEKQEMKHKRAADKTTEPKRQSSLMNFFKK